MSDSVAEVFCTCFVDKIITEMSKNEFKKLKESYTTDNQIDSVLFDLTLNCQPKHIQDYIKEKNIKIKTGYNNK